MSCSVISRRSLLFAGVASLAPGSIPIISRTGGASSHMQKRWLFIWRDMTDPKEVDRMIARFPAAQAAGYNGVAFGYNVAPERAQALKEASRRHGMALIALVMGGFHDRNYAEGVLAKDVLFLAHDGIATFQPDNPTTVVNGSFDEANGNHFAGWTFQDDEGVTTFADSTVTHGGKYALRMENITKNDGRHIRIFQAIKLQPRRQYHISVWVKTEGLRGIEPEVKVLAPDTSRSIGFQTFHVEPTQDWKRCDLSFNSFEFDHGNLYLGTWGGDAGKIWWADLKIEEMGLVNVLRRPGCPVTVRGESGATYEEGRDYQPIVDPELHPWVAYHDEPIIRLTQNTRIQNGERLRVSFYHSIIVYEDRVTGCISEPRIFDDWREEVQRADSLYHPDAFLLEHDEMRVMNQCALCQSKHMTPGELLAWNIHRSAQIVRDLRPDAEVWVWSDMFDPMHNAVDNYFAVNGSLKGSWKGLDKGIGIVNWNGGLLGKNCPFFANLGLRQILSGYYDGDDDGTQIAHWEANTKDVPGIVGAMYTTWADRYDAMTTWAKRAWGA